LSKSGMCQDVWTDSKKKLRSMALQIGIGVLLSDNAHLSVRFGKCGIKSILEFDPFGLNLLPLGRTPVQARDRYFQTGVSVILNKPLKVAIMGTSTVDFRPSETIYPHSIC